MRLYELRNCGTECATGSCAYGGDGAPEGGDIRFFGAAERAECDEVVSAISADEEKAVLGQPLLGERVLC